MKVKSNTETRCSVKRLGTRYVFRSYTQSLSMDTGTHKSVQEEETNLKPLRCWQTCFVLWGTNFDSQLGYRL